ncbi:MAG TPA: CehA/McbA family metallohydrolase [Herpetosiphonaceae bacterium]
MNTFTLQLSDHVSPADKRNHDYRYVPFTLPAPASRLHVSYRYAATSPADAGEETVIDLGLFDPHGTEFPGGAGFRGWSGGARSEFTITTTEATPGYLPGPLPAGTYQVLLGLYQIPPGGADYQITIAATLADELQPIIDALASPAVVTVQPEIADSARFWLRGDLQSHTHHSDAKGTPEQLTAKARALGLDFLAITDHNTISHHAQIAALADDALLLIPGQEVTTNYGHMNIWGTGHWCDFRCRSDDDMRAVIALAHAHGGVCSINHPKQDGPAWQYSPDLPVDALEVWQGPWPWRNAESLELWDRLLASGRRLPVVGGSDYHCPAGDETGFLRLGQPTTWVKVSARSVPAILAAIRAGRASISAAPDGPRLDLRATAGASAAEMGETLRIAPGAELNVEVQIERGADWTLRLIADGRLAHETPIASASAAVRHTLTAARYVRAELVGDAPLAIIPPHAPPDLDLRDWRWALTNPIYVSDDPAK